MRLDGASSIPAYAQIADLLRRSIAAGVYRSGEMIPSVRSLALELTVNPNTVQRAFEEIEREGLVHKRKGLGMFVTHAGANRAKKDSAAQTQRSFVDTLRAAQAAGMSAEEIRETFDSALRRVFKESESPA